MNFREVLQFRCNNCNGFCAVNGTALAVEGFDEDDIRADSGSLFPVVETVPDYFSL